MRITFQNTLKGERFAANEQIRQNNVNFENVPPTALAVLAQGADFGPKDDI